MVWLLGEVKQDLFYCVQSQSNGAGCQEIVTGHSFAIYVALSM